MAPVKKSIPTGRKDAKGRIIFKGPRGGEFVRGRNGSKLAPATGSSTRARSPMRRRSRSPMRRFF
ncbi:PBCV-specific basic adaptor domain-containing protein [Paramecium bursaria Chlorella virus CvsA1]|nr:PBCV-specific basic adaptor domain-containing protein [Paramecium bursaria Chlorella virus CviKI]AGE52580.1 PBCV-specific basic adaptor domain-containing protein [Paramecium bursaria Chlorella virus CvsA1]AGE55374.1 PBCV-specific basic adaptor domain-containing protein [Paramecium bursaria Chlorella virus MA1E]